MKKNWMILMSLAVALPMAMTAQTSVKDLPQEYQEKVSLFHEDASHKQYAEALANWKDVYENYPASTANIYIDGNKIVTWKLSTLTAGTPEYNEWRALLMKLHDDRIQYFGSSKKYPTAYILGEKGVDYCTYFTEDETRAGAYEWLKTSVQGMGAKSKISVVAKFAEVSYYMYKFDDGLAEQYIADYQLAADIYSQMASDETNKNAGAAGQYKDNLDRTFAGSGAASCDKLDELYAASVEDNQDNLDILSKIIGLYKGVNCLESDVYFAASAYAHVLQPSAESAVGCAAMSKKKGDWAAAIRYYDQAVELADNDEDKSEYLYRAAHVYFNNLKNYSEARRYCRESLALKSGEGQGRCYIMIAMMYAASRPYDDPILNKSVYWAAVDNLNKAKNIDPSCTEAANSLLSRYVAAYPTTEEVFFHNQLSKGASFTVGGWIGETTTVRTRD